VLTKCIFFGKHLVDSRKARTFASEIKMLVASILWGYTTKHVGAFDLWILTTVNDIIANLEIVGYPDFMGLHNAEGLYQPKGDIVGAFDLWMLTT
jgi:hypothetical protein